MPVVEIPGRGNVEFPDTMSSEDITNAIRQATSESGGLGSPEGKSPLDAMARKVVNLVVPQTPTELGAMAGTLALGGPLAGMGIRGTRAALGRIAGGAIGGEVGGQIEGLPTGSGAAMGAVSTAIPELGGAAWGKIRSSLPGGRRAVNLARTDAIANEIATYVPDLADVTTPASLRKAAIGSEIRNKIADRYVQSINETDRLIGGNALNVPTLGGPPMTLANAIERLKELGYGGFGGSKDVPVNRTMAGRGQREQWQRAIDEIRGELNRYNPTGEAVAAFDAGRKQYALGRTFLDMLKPGSTWRGTPDSPELNVNGLRGQFEAKYSKFERTMLPDELDAFVKTLYGGAPIGARDLMASTTGGMLDAARQLLRSGGGTGTVAVLGPRTLFPDLGTQLAGRNPLALSQVQRLGLDLGAQPMLQKGLSSLYPQDLAE